MIRRHPSAPWAYALGVVTSLAICNPAGLPVEDVWKFAHALDHQIREDFAPAWGKYAIPWVSGASAPEGSWCLYLWRGPQSAMDAGFLGRHEAKGRDHLPVGHVFVDVVQNFGESWTEVASHEALEMLADEWVNLDVRRETPAGLELWAREVCDAVQGTGYEKKGVRVSNFVLPEYFIPHSDGPFDHLRMLTSSFSICASGYASVTRIGTDGRATSQTRYGAEYPSWRRDPRSHSRREARPGVNPCVA
jgi:hypothetical protein